MDTRFYKEIVEDWLAKYFENKNSYNKNIYEAMYYSLKVGGKRIRPILTILSYALYKNDISGIIPIACSMEMIHTYSLIHDDLPCMDNDDLRRGQPTNHKVFGEGLAVLAGDALLNEAFSIMFNYCMERGTDAVKACKLISEASGAEGMIGGQVVDIESEGKRADEDILYYMHSKKTGELIKASILSGAIIGGASDKEIEILKEYGEKLGLAFQIKDDILDVEGNTELLGKNINSDTNNEKSTFVTLYGIEACKEKSLKLTEECIKLLKGLEKDTMNLEALTIMLLERNY
jgi:geranylgeranyl diphosphate synthase type II